MSFIFEGLLPDGLLIMNYLAWEKRHADSVPGGHAAWLMKQYKNLGKGKALLVSSDLCSGPGPIQYCFSIRAFFHLTSLEASLLLFFNNLFWLD